MRATVTSLSARLSMIVLVNLVTALTFQVFSEIRAPHVREQLAWEETLRLLRLVSIEQRPSGWAGAMFANRSRLTQRLRRLALALVTQQGVHVVNSRCWLVATAEEHRSRAGPR